MSSEVLSQTANNNQPKYVVAKCVPKAVGKFKDAHIERNWNDPKKCPKSSDPGIYENINNKMKINKQILLMAHTNFLT